MLTDAAIKALKPKDKLYKVTDRDGMYVVVNPSGAVVFRYDYRMHGRRETLTLGRYGPASIATFVPKDRSLSPAEIRVMLGQLEHVATLPTIRLGLKLILLTMVRKSELQDAVWDEVDFENAVWSIPKEWMKRSKPHNFYLCEQSLDILVALKTCADNSRYLLPSRYDADAPMSRATFI